MMIPLIDNGKLYSLALEFREAILKSLDSLSLVFSGFPNGCCGITSLMLGAYLAENNICNSEYVCGTDDSLQSHAWLEVDGIIIDITSDQFCNGVAVYVGGKSSLYDRFKEDSRHQWNASLEGNRIESDSLGNDYRSILKHIIQQEESL